MERPWWAILNKISKQMCCQISHHCKSSDENNMNHSSSKVEGLYTRMPTPVEKQQSKSASGSASAGLSSSSHSIIFRQKKKDSGYGSQGHLKLELVNYVCNANLAFSNSIQHKCLL